MSTDMLCLSIHWGLWQDGSDAWNPSPVGCDPNITEWDSGGVQALECQILTITASVPLSTSSAGCGPDKTELKCKADVWVGHRSECVGHSRVCNQEHLVAGERAAISLTSPTPPHTPTPHVLWALRLCGSVVQVQKFWKVN